MTDATRRRITWIPLGLLVALSLPFVIAPSLDLDASRQFYGGDGSWPLRSHPFVAACYEYGPGPGLAIAVPALLGWIASWGVARLRRHRRALGFVALAAIVGPWLLTNAVFKEHWGRPRPRELTEFGAAQTFVPLGRPGFEFKGRSFPSGHSAMAFFPLALFFVAASRERWRAAGIALAIGLVLGLAVGSARVMEGAHFPSDVLWAAAFVWFPSWGLARWLGLLPPVREPESSG